MNNNSAERVTDVLEDEQLENNMLNWPVLDSEERVKKIGETA